MQIKVKPVRGQRLEIKLDQTKLLLTESDCQEMRNALAKNLESFARHPASTWDEAREEFKQLLPTLEYLEKFADNELALLMREFDFTLLYRVCQQKPLSTLLKKLDGALGKREIGRLIAEGERLPLQPLWEVNLRIGALKRTIDRLSDEGEIHPPKMSSSQPTAEVAPNLTRSGEAKVIRQVLQKLDTYPDKALLAIFKSLPPRELAKLWFIIEEFSANSLLDKFNQVIPPPLQKKLKPAKPKTMLATDARKTCQLAVEVIKSLKSKKSSNDDTPPPSGPILV